jgi:hypothetical protein
MAIGTPDLTLLKLSEQLIAGPYQSGNPTNVRSALDVIKL